MTAEQGCPDPEVLQSGGLGHVVGAGASAERRERAPTEPAPKSARFPYVLAMLLVAATTALGLVIRALRPVPNIEMLYVVTVMLTAFFFGRRPSILAAIASVAAYDFFFVLPRLTFAVLALDDMLQPSL